MYSTTKYYIFSRSRTIAATNMNATSSRAHTIVKIQFVQKEAAKNVGSKAATTKTSEINLVDLAGRYKRIIEFYLKNIL
jgi:hypothetical protein